MKHLGDISKIHGAQIEPVDLITFGSPCQDLSVAGKRAGLKHETNGDEETTRSGLFMEAVRIIKEMREATDGKYPRFALWENVPGAFSSNKGEDFRIVLEEIAKISEADALMPEVPKSGWAYADCFSGDGWSMAYRVLDAQHWGVPQRRRRIFLVADFAGERAEEILFEREGLRGDFAEGGAPWQRVAAYAESCAGAESGEGTGSNGAGGQVAACLYAAYGTKWNGNAGAYNGENFVLTETPVCYGISSYGSNAMLSENPHSGIYEASTSRTLDLNGGNPACNQGGIAVVEPVIYDGVNITSPVNCSSPQPGDPCHTLHTDSRNIVVEPEDICDRLIETPAPELMATFDSDGKLICMATQQGGAEIREDDKAPTITAAAGMSGNNQPCVVYDARGNRRGVAAATVTGDHERRVTDYTNIVCSSEAMSLLGDSVAGTLKARDYKGIGRHDSLGSAVCICFDKEVYNSGINATGGHYISEGGPAPTLRASVPPGVAGKIENLPCLASGKDSTGCLMASGYEKLGAQEMFSGDYTVIEPQYIVRRLTPTECARLQGFADDWGHIDEKESFTEEEYRFWLEVRNTHAAINGKQIKDYTEKQMLSWYNKLHTDSAEYKMWGNGIALPPALYVMQGIAAAIEKAEKKTA